MVSRQFFFFTSESTYVPLEPPAAPASRHLRFTGIYSPRDRLASLKIIEIEQRCLCEVFQDETIMGLGQPKTSRRVFRYVAEPIIGRFGSATRRNMGSIKSEMHYPSRPGKRAIGWALARATTTPCASHTA